MNPRQTVIESITANSECLFPGVNQNDVRIDRVLQQRCWGLNITYSARFLCTVTLPGTAAAPRKLFVKCKGDVKKEYDNIKALWDLHYCRSRDYLIPRPLFLDRAHHLLFLDQVDGGGLLKGFYRNFLSAAAGSKLLQSRVAAIAHWLVDFQQIYRSADDHNMPDELLDYENKVRQLYGLSAAEQRRVIEKMRRVVQDFPRYQETFVTRQFLPRNVMFTDNEETVCVVDFPKLTKGWPFYDFLTFLLAIEKLQLYPLISRTDCESVKSTFAAEYFSRGNLRYDRELVENLWAAYAIADLRRLYQVYKGVRLKGLGNNYFAYKTVRRLAEWSKR